MKIEVVILGAGEGKRMCSALPKVLHRLGGKTLLQHVLDACAQLRPSACHLVVGHGADQVRQSVADTALNCIEQSQQLGTGHAVLQALPAIADDALVLVLYADVPLVSSASLQALVRKAEQGLALLTAEVPDPTGYGRILRSDQGDQSDQGDLVGVVEQRDASAAQQAICEINSGIMAAPAGLLRELLPQVGNDNAQGEYYLPDVLSLAVGQGRTVATVRIENPIDILGVNDRLQLNTLEREYQRRLAAQLMREGVTLADAQRIDIRGELVCERDVFIDANVLFEGRVSLASGVTIGANSVLINCEVGAGVEVKPFSHLEGAVIGSDCSIGPFARLRPDTRLESSVRIGNFVETKKSHIRAGSKVNHLSYIGDCQMGEAVNIGAGTITCNYDGAHKHTTHIGDGVFVGSNTTLVAPLSIEAGGFVGAGSIITKPVAKDQLAISRARQRNLDGWQRPVKKEN
jgi:bifunctional UDP-N-acetylglucosamine pyrophosphorylase/glucosamine-1-phosphate N-acetyltransferase